MRHLARAYEAGRYGAPDPAMAYWFHVMVARRSSPPPPDLARLKAAVPPERLAEALERLKANFQAHGLRVPPVS
jgi:hypothetical protein